MMPADTNKPLPLAGVRVLDIASLYAAPLAATTLADFGAEVIKVEPLGGDGFRNTRMWPVVARNKKSITLDLRQPEGCDVLKALIAKTDILIENYPAAVLEKRGIAYQHLSACNPDLIMVSVSCFGQSGPYAPRPGSGTIGEGFGGLVHMVGNADGPPMLPSFPLGDAVGALNIVVGAMMALYWRDAGRAPGDDVDRTRRGQHIDASLYEPVLFAISQVISRWEPGKAPKRSGSRLLTSAIRNVYATADGEYVVISASTERHLVDLLKLASGEMDDADAAVARWIATLPMREVVEKLIAARVPIAPINDVEALLSDAHIQARESLVRVDDAELGALALVAPSPRLSHTPGSIRSVGPALAAHNDEVYRDLLGIDSERLQRLRSQKVI